MKEQPEDTCECGDYRRDHPNNGPCRMNQRGFDLCHAGKDCMSFHLHQPKEATDGE